VADVAERATDAGVAPAWVLLSHPEDELPNLGGRLGATGPASLTPVVLPGDEPPVPAKQCVGRHQRADLEETFAADLLGPARETPALSIGQEQAPFAELLSEHPILRLQVLDHVLLAAVHPPGEEHHQTLKLQSAHLRKRTSGRASHAGPRATIVPASNIPESLAF